MLAKLDRIYSYNPIENVTEVEEYYILGKSSHSNHLPVWCKLALQPKPKKKSTYKMNSFFLRDPAIKENFMGIWETQPLFGFFGKMRKYLKFYRQYCIKKAQERCFKEEEFRTGLARMVEVLQEDPSNLDAQLKLSEVSDQLKDFEDRKAEGLRIRSCMKWNQVGDVCTKEFFQAN